MTCPFSFLADRGLGKCGISSLFAWFVLNCGWCVSKNPAVGPEFPEAEPQGMSGRAFPQGNRWSQGFLRCGVRGGPVGGRRPEGNRDGARLRSPPRFHGRRCRPGDGTGHRAISPAGVLVRTVHGLFSAAPVRAGRTTFLYRPERKSRAGGGRIEMRSRRPFANGRPPGPAASGTDVSPAFRGRRTAEFRIRSRAPRSGGRRRGGRGRAAPARRETAAAWPRGGCGLGRQGGRGNKKSRAPTGSGPGFAARRIGDLNPGRA